ncbi:branched-chain amino acid transport system ATP-binding protein [Streptacidiphilus sp. MAP12-16]|uniref:ATP-binding cassette domain-containing protein n=1 Tax=Streptacidiphilus sp. MAP12-16 TaxID=3156300 RepID=UPI0035119864
MAVEIALSQARVRYGPLEALHGVDLGIPAGRRTMLLGRNGAGRSTVLHALAGTEPLSGGQVLWYGGEADARDITGLGAYRRARLGLTLVPAERAVFPSLSVADHLSWLDDAARDAALDLFPELRRLLGRSAGTLSGGEQQMVALAAALAGPSRLLLLDELGRGLAAPVVARVHGALAAAVAAGRTVVLAEQVLPSGPAAPDLVYVLHRGSVVFAGEPGELEGTGISAG